MQTATVELFTSEHNQLIKRGVTPAEAVIMARMHGPRSKGRPIGRVIIEGDEERDTAEERERLHLTYTGTIGEGKEAKGALEAVFPNEMAELPETFSEVAKHLGAGAQIMTPEGAKKIDEALKNAVADATSEAELPKAKGKKGKKAEEAE